MKLLYTTLKLSSLLGFFMITGMLIFGAYALLIVPGCNTLLGGQNISVQQIKTMNHKDRAALAMAVWNSEYDAHLALVEAYQKKYKEGGFPPSVTADLEERKANLKKTQELIKKYDNFITGGLTIPETVMQDIMTYLTVRYGSQ